MTEGAPHVLIVDDHRDIRDALSRYLQDNGLKVTMAESAASARRVLSQREIDLIVLDIMMPGEDGLSLCRQHYKASGLGSPIDVPTASNMSRPTRMGA